MTQRQANLAYNLRPHVQSDGSTYPLFRKAESGQLSDVPFTWCCYPG